MYVNKGGVLLEFQFLSIIATYKDDEEVRNGPPSFTVTFRSLQKPVTQEVVEVLF